MSTHVLTEGTTADLTIKVEGLIETHDTGGVLRGTDERFSAEPVPALDLAHRSQSGDGEISRAICARSPKRDVLGFLHALMMQINEHMTFDEDPTNSGTSAVEAFGLKRGVCQDYAHIFIACARSGLVPARFVSGHFLRSDGTVHQAAGTPGPKPSCRISAGRLRSGQRHLHHRRPCPRCHWLDYLGAAPVRGTRYGGGMETLTVAVKVEPAGGRQGQWQSQS